MNDVLVIIILYSLLYLFVGGFYILRKVASDRALALMVTDKENDFTFIIYAFCLFFWPVFYLAGRFFKK